MFIITYMPWSLNQLILHLRPTSTTQSKKM
jgi:hypothetical protein